MTRRLVAAALIAGFGLTVSPALAYEDQQMICVGGDDRNNPGQVKNVCIHNPLEIVRGR